MFLRRPLRRCPTFARQSRSWRPSWSWLCGSSRRAAQAPCLPNRLWGAPRMGLPCWAQMRTAGPHLALLKLLPLCPPLHLPRHLPRHLSRTPRLRCAYRMPP